MLNKMTLSQSAKTKKPLSELHQIKQAVKKLQKDSEDQLKLEIESQATFNYFGSEIKALKTAFTTFSQVIMSEVDNIRKETIKKYNELYSSVSKHEQLLKNIQQDMNGIQTTLTTWTLKERDWAKDNEILKSYHSHNIEWMQQLQRDIINTREDLQSMKHENSIRVKDVFQETNNLRSHWEKSMNHIEQTLNDYDIKNDKYNQEIKFLTSQRIEDMEIMEKAIITAQKQQIESTGNIEENLQSLLNDNKDITIRIEKLETRITSDNVSLEQVKIKLINVEKDQRMRFENISKSLNVFSELLSISRHLVTSRST